METPTVAEKRWNRRGPQLDDDWQERYLLAVRKTGTKWKAARMAGVHRDTVVEYEHRDPAFAVEAEHARQEYIDQCEVELHRVGRRANNPLAYFGLLKRHRPEAWNDRILSISLTATTELAPDVGADLLRRILAGGVTDATLQALGPHEDSTTHALGETQSERIIEGECQPLTSPPANAREARPALDTPPRPASSPSASS